jgi:thiamine kinase-like enzyme
MDALRLDSDEFSIHFLAQGAANAAFRVLAPKQEDLVLRIGMAKATRPSIRDQAAGEADVLRFLHGHAVTADLLWLDLDGGRLAKPVLGMSFLAGREFAYELSDTLAIARLHARLHEKKGTPPASVPMAPAPIGRLLGECRPWLDRYVAWSGANKDTVAQFESAFARVAETSDAFETPVLVHGDATYVNFRLKAGEARAFDWDWCRIAPAAWDASHLLAPVTTLRCDGRQISKEHERAYLEEYLQHRGEADRGSFLDEFRRLRPAIQLHSAAWTAAHLAILLSKPVPTHNNDAEPCYLNVDNMRRQIDADLLAHLHKEGVW